MNRVIVVGATSGIAQAVARRLMTPTTRGVLIARNAERLEQVAQDLTGRGCGEVHTLVADLDELDAHVQIVQRSWTLAGGCDVLLIAHGTLPNQGECEASVETTLAALRTNAISPISLLTLFANKLAAQRGGSIVVISSVAGDRGRRSNYVYGGAKAAVTAFASGLRGRLSDAGVHVLTIKPGWVDTPMTAEFEKGALWATPDAVARQIVGALKRRSEVAYTPGFWRLISFVLRSIPERWFKRLKL